MAQNGGFNYNFSDERHMPMSPRTATIVAAWDVGQGQDPCNASIQGPDFSEHLRIVHGVTGHEKMQLRCWWMGCGSLMKKESVVRHVQEMHLGWRYSCSVCGEEFSRNHSMAHPPQETLRKRLVILSARPVLIRDAKPSRVDWWMRAFV
ncbi:hypothetical protein BU15DRAFT_59914 [Melanogaster broomeanus]|nr:hypothetical protein BU15DRAFT_59914 [Melanogaster broomeanus]